MLSIEFGVLDDSLVDGLSVCCKRTTNLTLQIEYSSAFSWLSAIGGCISMNTALKPNQAQFIDFIS